MFSIPKLFVEIDECVSSPCEYSGTCVDQVNGYVCNCAPGYTDTQCQTGQLTQQTRHVHTMLV